MQGADGERYGDALGLIALVQALDEFVLDNILVRELFRPQNDREIDRGVAEGVVAGEGLEITDPAGNFLHDLPGHLDGRFFDLFQVALIGNAHLHQDRTDLFRKEIILDDGFGNMRVGNDVQVVGELAHRGVAPVDVNNESLFTAAQANVISRDGSAWKRSAAVRQRGWQGFPAGPGPRPGRRCPGR